MAKRNLERIREILLHIEGIESADGWVDTYGDAFWVREDEYQIDLARQAGFLEGEVETMGTFVPDPIRITTIGHDYLDAIRDQGVWQKTKDAVTETGGSVTLEIIKSLATGFLKKKIEQHTGITL